MSTFDEILQQPIIIGFSLLILIVFLVDLYFIIKGTDNYENNLRSALVNLGMLGTFVGIFLGLLHFNADTAETIADSVPDL